RALADAARREGAEILEGVTATSLGADGGRITSVETSEGPISTGSAVLANGAWSVPLARGVGLELPIEPVAIRVAFAERPERMRRGVDGHLVVLDRACGCYTRPEGEALSLIGLQSSRHPI